MKKDNNKKITIKELVVKNVMELSIVSVLAVLFVQILGSIYPLQVLSQKKRPGK